MDDPKANPVGRLFLLLRHFSQMPDTTTNLSAFAKYLAFKEQATPQLIGALGTALTLPGEARAAFGRIEKATVLSAEEGLALFDRADRAVAEMVNLSNSCNSVKGFIDSGMLMALRFISGEVGTVEPEPTLSAEQIEAIRSAAVNLIEAIRHADDLPSAVKRILFDHVDAVLLALRTIELDGVEELIRQRDRLEGHVQRQPSSFLESIRNSKVKTAFVVFSLALSGAAGTIHDAIEVTDGVKELFEIVSPHAHETVLAPKQLERLPGDSRDQDEDEDEDEDEKFTEQSSPVTDE